MACGACTGLGVMQESWCMSQPTWWPCAIQQSWQSLIAGPKTAPAWRPANPPLPPPEACIVVQLYSHGHLVLLQGQHRVAGTLQVREQHKRRRLRRAAAPEGANSSKHRLAPSPSLQQGLCVNAHAHRPDSRVTDIHLESVTAASLAQAAHPSSTGSTVL